ncbi:dynamin family protein [Lederbergia sp. NSJ-179]|uniref:dynamin family protein n=1 Tax=Lederbergia sp. NSJ-179 TaxID=2931402 RepID=UPI001FD546FB|nr:dynamin family protein [Lederbergia sp. NSJ-179]MCJ7839506.1 dynamin family protein [Lederbergia sp. NSJ-179]
MDKVVLSSSQEQSLHQALILLNRFQEHGDKDRVVKARQLIKKLVQNECVIAFSGHFSVGKSSMINHLIGAQILPSSPIPTSANLVKVHMAETDFAKVFRRHAPPLLFNAPYDFAMIQDYCTKGEITEVEIGRKDVKLPAAMTILDTPGIDSTDEAHRLSTESALHMADAVFYVMDYNHVQSELNFIYTKNLLRHGVRLYLIINQIDKHQSTELSFLAYKQSVIDSFSDWGVKPAGIFFTTLKAREHPENEIETVKMIIQDRFAYPDEWRATSIQASFKQMIEEHEHWLNELLQQESVLLHEEILKYNKGEKKDPLEEVEFFKQQKNTLLHLLEEQANEYATESEKILKNAYLMPYETRELAEQFLQSRQPDFKMGLFFSKKKTEEERKKRLDMFAAHLEKQVESQIVWHLRELASSLLQANGLDQSEWQRKAQSIRVDWPVSLLEETINKGAGVNGQYVLHYCEEVAERIKRLAKREWDQFKTPILKIKQQKINRTIAELDEKLTASIEAANAKQELLRLEEKYEQMKREITVPAGREEETLQGLREQWREEAAHVIVYKGKSGQEEKKLKPISVERPSSEKGSTQLETSKADQVIQTLERAIQLFERDPYFERITEQLKDKVTTVKERNYMIALFGAFSAGKSSLANALLGEAILPVSPNPTTASINRICPPSKDHPHGTALVHLKNEADLLADVEKAFSYFGESCPTLAAAFQKIPSLFTSDNGEEKAKFHLSFLTAFRKGYPKHHSLLGKSFITDSENFRQYVGDEVQSCFVESIDLFYDCSLTRQGITLVDTPGADSINARHTGVAFDYIKNADAILFVTYYNHAFSKADREFLIQLGRVKDSFELDKMFFIVNAIDLAASQTEAEEVLHYVGEELQKNGIRFPKLFGVSSKLALQKGQREVSNMDHFQSEFDSFLRHDLTKMTVQSAKAEYNRALRFLDQLIASANEDQIAKDARRAEWQQSKAEMLAVLSGANPEILSKQLAQEAKELLYYVKQRVFYRFSHFFKEAFNPAALKKNDRSLLKKCLQELLEAVGYDFSQELRVTSLRLEQYTQKSLKRYYASLEKELQSIKTDIAFSQIEWSSSPTPEFTSAFVENDRQPFENQFKYFRNPKAFFELNEKKKMEAAFLTILSPLADEYLQQEFKRITDFYEHYLVEEYAKLIDHVRIDVNEQFEAWFQALGDRENLAEWLKMQALLSTKNEGDL